MTDLRLVPPEPLRPEPWEGPTERGRAMIAGARDRLRRGRPYRTVEGDREVDLGTGDVRAVWATEGPDEGASAPGEGSAA